MSQIKKESYIEVITVSDNVARASVNQDKVKQFFVYKANSKSI